MNTWKPFVYTLASLLLIVGIARGIENMQEVSTGGPLVMVLAFLSWDGIFPFFLLMVIIVWYGDDYGKVSKVWRRRRKILAVFEYQGSNEEKQIDDTTTILLYLLSFQEISDKLLIAMNYG
mgnify:CR=1 FL=1